MLPTTPTIIAQLPEYPDKIEVASDSQAMRRALEAIADGEAPAEDDMAVIDHQEFSDRARHRADPVSPMPLIERDVAVSDPMPMSQAVQMMAVAMGSPEAAMAYISECRALGRSPYGRNRHARRAADAVKVKTKRAASTAHTGAKRR